MTVSRTASVGPSLPGNNFDVVVGGRLRGLLLAFLSIPVLWLLGLGLIQWLMLACFLVVGMAARGEWFVDRSFAYWSLFLVCVLLSAVNVSTSSRVLSYGYRTAMYFASAVFFLYAYNRIRSGIPLSRLARVVSVYWFLVVVGGFLGLALPGVTIHSVTASLVPQSVANNEFVGTLLNPRFAQVQSFQTFGFPRPATLFGYTNGWGSAYAILTPVAVGAALTLSGARRRWMWVCIGLSAVPAVLSVNRGLWLSLTVGLVFIAVQYVQVSRRDTIRIVVGLAIVAAALYYLTPLGHTVASRLSASSTSHEQSRLSRDSQALGGSLKSPIIGHGAPTPNPDPNLPSIGTESEFFLLAYCYAGPGLLLFVSFFLAILWRTRRRAGAERDDVATWMRVSLVVFLAQIPYYELTYQLPVTMVIAGGLVGHTVLTRRRLAASA